MLRRLLELPQLVAKMKLLNPDRSTPLERAVQGGSIECLELLLAAGADLSTALPIQGTALHVAARSGHHTMLAHLLTLPGLRAQVNLQTEWGDSALMEAIEAGSFQCYKLLRDAGADCSPKMKWGQNALHLAKRGRSRIS
eukprot:m.624735 g.624735  ORF g.624735 m.624735 type:complete len:140 (-) comp58236_c0_seq5:756-1175(-)